MLRASLLLCVISGTVTACAKDPIRTTARELVELRAKADPLSVYCRTGQWMASAHRAQDVAGCTQTPHPGARSGW